MRSLLFRNRRVGHLELLQNPRQLVGIVSGKRFELTLFFDFDALLFGEGFADDGAADASFFHCGEELLCLLRRCGGE